MQHRWQPRVGMLQPPARRRGHTRLVPCRQLSHARTLAQNPLPVEPPPAHFPPLPSTFSRLENLHCPLAIPSRSFIFSAMKPALRALLAGLLLCSFTACGKKDDHAGHDHSAHAKHAHAAPHGGTLVELGEHAFNLEFVRDAATGKLTAYVLDGHAEDFVRISAPSFGVVVTVAGAKQKLTLNAVANPATGEKVGASSQFEASADWLKTTAALEGVIDALTIRDNAFKNVAFTLPKI
jgi:hypothetical protein